MTFVYLDLNKWVELARCALGRNERVRPVLNFLAKHGRRQELCCPASLSTLVEVSKQRNKRRREELAEFIAGFCGGVFLAPPYELQQWELRNAISKTFGFSNTASGARIFGRGVDFAFGQDFSEDLKGEVTPDVIERLKSPEGAYMFMAGSPETEHLLELGRKIVDEQAEKYVRDTEELRSRSAEYSKDVRRRAVLANELLGFRDQLVPLLSEYQLTFQDLLSKGRPALEAFFGHAPSINVWIKLTTTRNAHGDRPVEKNDLADLRSLSSAIPYCRAVVTERFWTSVVHQHNLGGKYSTLVTHDLNDLLALSV